MKNEILKKLKRYPKAYTTKKKSKQKEDKDIMEGKKKEVIWLIAKCQSFFKIIIIIIIMIGFLTYHVNVNGKKLTIVDDS